MFDQSKEGNVVVAVDEKTGSHQWRASTASFRCCTVLFMYGPGEVVVLRTLRSAACETRIDRGGGADQTLLVMVRRTTDGGNSLGWMWGPGLCSKLEAVAVISMVSTLDETVTRCSKTASCHLSQTSTPSCMEETGSARTSGDKFAVCGTDMCMLIRYQLLSE